jgi:hypothetical protein
MTLQEIKILKELLKDSIKSVVKEVIKEEYNNALKKDLKEVKLLLAKSIREGYIHSSTENVGGNTQNREEFRKKLRESVGEDFRTVVTKSTANVSTIPKMSISPEQATQISMNGTLPNVDAPIPMIKKDSQIWRDLKEKTS